MKIKYLFLGAFLMSLCIGAYGVDSPIGCVKQKFGCEDVGIWEEIGEGSASGGGITNISGFNLFGGHSLVTNGSGNPVVAWCDNRTGNYQIYLKQWNGSSWEELGGSASGGGVSNTPKSSSSPSLTMNVSGNSIIAWTASYGTDNTEIYLKQWNGTSWEEIGGSASEGGVSNTPKSSSHPTLAINGSGKPVVAWLDYATYSPDIYLKQWNGTSWEELGGSATGGGLSNTTGATENPILAINGSGKPVVAWEDNSSGITEIYLKQWNGSAWVELGGSASGGGVSNTDIWSAYASIAINNSGNPVIAWNEDNPKIYIKQWNGTSWEEIGTRIDSGIDISNNPSWSLCPSLQINNLGNPVVAWTDYSSGGPEIYLKQWTGTNWEEIGGSATGTGISNSSGQCTILSMALNGSGNPVVAWQDDSSGTNQIYIKQHIPQY